MGQLHSSGSYFHAVIVKDQFTSMQSLWTVDDLATLVTRLKDMSLNFSLDKVKFAKLLQLSSDYDAVVLQWFDDFAKERASQVVDGLEFLSAAILVSSQLALYSKICLLFDLFDLDKTSCIRKDEFTIFLKATTTGLYRVLTGVPPPSSVSELGGLSSEFFGTLKSGSLLKQDFLQWVTEAHFSLNYLSLLSRLDVTVFTWGANQRCPLGLNMEPIHRQLPSPLLNLEGIRIQQIATHESHSLFLTDAGQVWSCGGGFSGILGHGDLKNRPQPQLIDALAHARITSIAAGVRHSVAISEKGQVFTWGCGDLGQLGHGSVDDISVHEQAFDAKTGGTFAYICKPTVVMGLFGKKILGKQAVCCNFTTLVLTDQGDVYSFGNNTDGQCGLGQRCLQQKLVHVEPHMHRTAMQAVMEPTKIEVPAKFSKLGAGGYHCLAIESKDSSQGGRLWSWGRGLYGKLGHGDQRSMYDPRCVEALRHQACYHVDAGDAHSLCLCSLSRLTITGGRGAGQQEEVMLNPFSLLGLPLARSDLLADARQQVTLSGTALQVNAYASAPLVYLGLPLRFDPERPLGNLDGHTTEELSSSVVLIDRGLWEGQWLKLNTTDFDFHIRLSNHGAQITPKTALMGGLMMPLEGKWDYAMDCTQKICIFELAPRCEGAIISQEKLSALILEMASECVRARALACLCILPKDVELFDLAAPQNGMAANLSGFPYGMMSYEHGVGLKKHLQRLVTNRAAEAPDGKLEETRDWIERIEDFTGRVFYENQKTSEKRWTLPQADPKTQATVAVVREDSFVKRLKAVLTLRPKAIVVSQQSWRPDVEFKVFPEEVLEASAAPLPIVMVTYEAGEELKGVISSGSRPIVSMEVQPAGGVFAWGNGTIGQLGLAGIENQSFLEKSINSLTQEEAFFTSQPCYVAHLHEHQVCDIACGSQHTVAATEEGEVLAWGLSEAVGVVVDKQKKYYDAPVFVDQFEGLAKSKRVFAGHNHSFALAAMPYKSIV